MYECYPEHWPRLMKTMPQQAPYNLSRTVSIQHADHACSSALWLGTRNSCGMQVISETIFVAVVHEDLIAIPDCPSRSQHNSTSAVFYKFNIRPASGAPRVVGKAAQTSMTRSVFGVERIGCSAIVPGNAIVDVDKFSIVVDDDISFTEQYVVVLGESFACKQAFSVV